MKTHEFYQKYANTPLAKRQEYLGYDYRDVDGQNYTLNMIYQEIKKIDDKTRKDLIIKDRLLNIVDKYYKGRQTK